MKNSLILPFLIFKIIVVSEPINAYTITVFNFTSKTTQVYRDENEELKINVNQDHLENQTKGLYSIQ